MTHGFTWPGPTAMSTPLKRISCLYNGVIQGSKRAVQEYIWKEVQLLFKHNAYCFPLETCLWKDCKGLGVSNGLVEKIQSHTRLASLPSFILCIFLKSMDIVYLPIESFCYLPRRLKTKYIKNNPFPMLTVNFQTLFSYPILLKCRHCFLSLWSSHSHRNPNYTEVLHPLTSSR